MTLGEMIAALERLPADKPIRFSFCGLLLRTAGLDSYRGYYEQLALGWTADGVGVSVGALLARLRQAVGETFTGWKGGEYTMGTHTPLWAANPGEGGRAIVGVTDRGWCVTIETEYAEA